jgi:hypothetical protein
MQAYRVETTVEHDGSVTLHDLPFQEGEPIETIILQRTVNTGGDQQYPLRGTPIQYSDPTEPVAAEDWAELEMTLEEYNRKCP